MALIPLDMKWILNQEEKVLQTHVQECLYYLVQWIENIANKIDNE